MRLLVNWSKKANGSKFSEGEVDFRLPVLEMKLKPPIKDHNINNQKKPIS